MVTASPAASKPPAGADKKCDICEATFSRQEHLVRHIKSHTREKPFRCLICGKGFARQDVLSRHRTSHRQDNQEARTDTRSRACRQCATSRARCSRSDPCRRCVERNLACTFPAARKPKAPGIVGSRMEVDGEPRGSSLEAIHQTVGRRAEDGATLLTIGPGASVNINGADLDECGPDGANGTRLASGTDAWAQRPALFQVSQPVGSVDPGTQRIYEFHSMSGLNEQAMDLLSMNWMSPDSTSFGWNGLITAPPYAEDDKSDLYMPFLFPAAGALPDPDRECVSSNGQEPGIVRHDTSASSVGHSTYTPSKIGSEVNKSVTGSYYVDGDGSRAPFRGQTARRWRGRHNDASTPGSSITNCTDGGPSGSWEGPLVSADGYNNLIRELGREDLVVDANFFPSLQCIDACVRSYFANFHPTFPFVRKKTFLEESNNHWKLLLAVAVVGSKYNTSNEEPQLSPEFMAILDSISSSQVCYHEPAENEIPSGSPSQGLAHNAFDLPSLQAASLSLICSLHRGKSKMARHALLQRHYLVEACNQLNLLSGESEDTHAHHDYNKLVQDWSTNQSRIRTGLMIWLLDAIISYEFNAASLMQLVDAKVLLPCQDHIWEYPSAEKVIAEQTSSVTLLAAVETLYIEKRLPDSLSEFSTILIIHSIWRRTKEVINQNRTQLANWIPSATIQTREDRQSASTETWPPSSPILSKWRNSACDCLDILHWRANAKAATAGGLEYPAIMYLHLSRLILLTPVAQIQTLATNPRNTNTTHLAVDQGYTDARNHVLKWAMNDSFKARLAIIHAGALFWHIRRYSTRSFLEPFTIYMATLVIWAYSVSVQFARQQEESQAAPSMEGPEARTVAAACQQPATSTQDEGLYSELPFFFIDRPCDDEMVQMYLRFGNKMSAHMARVGVITQASAPSKILHEGVRLLENATAGVGSASIANDGGQNGPEASTWGAERTYMEALVALARAMEQKQA
ncbi:transcriptional regulator family: C2H2 zinc finger and Fungal Specific TF [Trichoderma aggressivum f. europaeum]|uniref:Transcriptional regulator family: C2H2 zinc finger and Fungal Specific TF n=1 Tax=Trichoderma aggressivum f. europaeum TaxID=173218 RepID=A0AAE1LVD9_9HYPO|nr:transcriptional regulator family: C2H2 zinc finger and Fungal Specific TF [Trichoderma aggressivum f. europaeum]